ncbi:MAG TPA: tetratricopeptide repeat protein [Candidatus Omnitrophota bacterium]|nr:tetratricopeptide repeat protein [Candidatus Omnitrophota bacterium]HPT38824.1 tetratricopeptide repeat protein [Candidatus Omnitrophota bacterium]
MKNLKIVIPVFLILLITLFSFYPCLKNNFTNWDDNLYVTENKAIRSVSLENLKHISVSFFITHYQPVTIFSYLLDYHFFKLNPFGYHLTNLILHLLNCLLVFWLIYMLTGKIAIACLVALGFGIHPIQAESVAWISERKNLLYAFFYLGAIISYLNYLGKEEKLKYYYSCLALFSLSLLSKSMALTLPLVLLSLDYLLARKIDRKLFMEKIPFFVLSLLFGLIALAGGRLAKVFFDENSYSLFTRLTGAAYDIIFYLGKIFLPVKFSVLYPYTEIKNNPLYLYSFALVIILFVIAAISMRYSRKIIFGVGFFCLTIFPALRFLPLDDVLVADRYVYLPVIGIFYLAAEGLFWLYCRPARYIRLARGILVSGLVLAVIFLTFSTRQRSRVWKDSVSLWNNVLANYPNIAAAYNNRGEALMGRGQFQEAYADFKLAMQVAVKPLYNPTYKYYYLNLGDSLRALGKNQEAIAIFTQLIKEEEDYFNRVDLGKSNKQKNSVMIFNRLAVEAGAYLALANIEDSLGNKNQAAALYTKVTELGNRWSNTGIQERTGSLSSFALATVKTKLYAYDALGILYAQQGREQEAQNMFFKAMAIDPAYEPAYSALAGIYKASGRKKELEALYKKAVVNHVDLLEAYYYFGNLFVDAQQDRQAIPFYRKVIELDPSFKAAYVSLGNAYLTTGRNKAAITWFKKALKLDPRLAVAHNNLAAAYYYAQEYDLAVGHSDQAAALGYTVNPKFLELLKPYKK